MDVVDRFSQLMARPVGDIELDHACLLVAAAIEPGTDIDAGRRRLDDLAARVPAATVPDVVHQLFRVEGFEGDRGNYYDPRNSLLPSVLDRRRGIPITLSVVAIEVGRRVGVELVGVGMPGHFLVGDPNDSDTFIDVFSGGALLDRAACQRRFASLHGDRAPFLPSYLDPVDPRAVLARVLANLEHIYRAGKARQSLVEVLRLRAALPGARQADQVHLGNVLSEAGRFDEAATVLESVAVGAEPAEAERLRAAAVRLRAQLN